MKIKEQRLIKYGITVIVFCAIFVVASAVKVKAGTGDNTSGWLWGGSEDANMAGTIGVIDGNETGVGWISTNSSNCDPNNDGITEGGSTNNPTYPNCPSGIAVKSYGVTIPAVDGKPVTGYAWSGGINSNDQGMGWIDFNPQDHCTTGTPDPIKFQYKAASCTPPNPPGGSAGVFFHSAGKTLTGWARFVGIAQETATGNAGGWEGWIEMKTVSLDASGNLTGYGWNGEEPGSGSNMANGLGWINFSGSKAVCIPNYSVFSWAKIPTGTPACTNATCGTTITTANYICSAEDKNNCGKIPDDTYCLTNVGSKPAPETQICPACGLNPGPWKEVTP
jgi:hypothetical protein